MTCPALQACPCGSAKTFGDCCGVFITTAAHAATAQQLMRARYSAHVCGDEEYLRQTWHPQTRPDGPSGALSSSADIVWCGLQVVACRQGLAPHTQGEVEFIARYQCNGENRQLHELSQFVKQQGRWFYLRGEIRPAGVVMGKTARNAPCPCGSGRKFKRCCAK